MVNFKTKQFFANLQYLSYVFSYVISLIEILIWFRNCKPKTQSVRVLSLFRPRQKNRVILHRMWAELRNLHVSCLAGLSEKPNSHEQTEYIY